MEVEPHLTHDDHEDIFDARKKIWAHLKRNNYPVNTAINALIHTFVDILLDSQYPPGKVNCILLSVSSDYKEKFDKENPP